MNIRLPDADLRGRWDFFARCIRGIEWIVAAEVETRLRPHLLVPGHREIRFSTHRPPSLRALHLATADDVFLAAGEAEGVGRGRDCLSLLRALGHAVPWAATLVRLRYLRPDAVWSAFSISASVLGRRNYNRYEIEDHVGEGAAAALGLPYRPSRMPRTAERELSIRIHLAGTRALVGLRVFDAPLHRRAYKQRSCAGTLHPPLAAAMAVLAGLRPDARVLDPFAGVGTIAIEAGRLQPRARVAGADLDLARLMDAAGNALHARVPLMLVRADAAHLPWGDGAFDRVVSNVPWERAVAAGGRLAHASAARDAEIARVLAAGGRAVLLVDSEDPLGIADDAGLTLPLKHRSWLSVSGRHPRLCLLAREGGAIDPHAPLGRSLQRWIRHADTVEIPVPG